MINRPHVSVLIPTYKRAHLIGHVLDALQKQSYHDFEVIVALKPTGDGTEEVVKRFEKNLNIELALRKGSSLTDGLNLGLEHAKGDVIVFLDDDAIPRWDWLQNYVNTYNDPSIGGVAGDVVPAVLKEGSVYPKTGVSEVIPYAQQFMRSIRLILWSCPLKGLENHLIYISKAGRVSYDPRLSQNARVQTTKSLLGMGANMSVLSKTVKGFRFPDSWIIGLAWEQYLGWYVWKQGYTLVFNPKAIVSHLVHNQSLSRSKANAKREALRVMDGNLLFYRLYGLEQNLSRMHRIVWLIYSSMENIKKICWNHELERFAWIRGTFYSELIGLKWQLSRKIGGRYDPLVDLEKLSGMN